MQRLASSHTWHSCGLPHQCHIPISNQSLAPPSLSCTPDTTSLAAWELWPPLESRHFACSRPQRSPPWLLSAYAAVSWPLSGKDGPQRSESAPGYPGIWGFSPGQARFSVPLRWGNGSDAGPARKCSYRRRGPAERKIAAHAYPACLGSLDSAHWLPSRKSGQDISLKSCPRFGCRVYRICLVHARMSCIFMVFRY